MHHSNPTSLVEKSLGPQAMQRAFGRGSFGVRKRGEESRLAALYQEGCAKIRLPRVANSAPLEAILINTSGGLTGGDRLSWQIDIGPDARASATTQACERVYKASADIAFLETRITVAKGAAFSWLPQETILFDRSALARSLTVEMDRESRFLIVEPLIFGRQAMGEQVEAATYRDRWRIRMDGRMVHGEDVALEGAVAQALARSAIAGNARALATVLLIGDDADAWLEPARRILGETGGASAWRVGSAGKLLARLTAQSGYELRQRLIPLIALLNGRAGLPKIWTT